MSALPAYSTAHHPASRAAVTSSPHQTSLTWLNRSAFTWLLVALLGQLIFAAYIVGLYGRAALAGRFEDWNKVMPSGYTPGDTVGNLIIASHLLFTVVIVLGGMLQLIPRARRVMPAVHRWNGRLYIAAASILSLGGLAMLWTKGTVGGPLQHLGVSLNAVLILIFAGLAWHHAHERRPDIHRRWALRLWLAVSGVWFFRIGLMAWIAINQGPAGFDPKTFQGPFLSFLSFAQYLVPLAVLELYLRAKAHGSARSRAAVAAVLIALTLLTALGIAVATKVMWLPRI